jgi:uncharacterized membrane protein
MLVRIEKSIEIKVTPDKVWEMLALDKAVEWMEGWKTVKYTSEVRVPEDKYKVGATALIAEHVKYDFEITESLENAKMVWQSAGGRAKPKMIRSYTLKHTETGTLVMSVFDYTSPFSVLGKIVDKTGGQRIAEKDVEKSLEKLKSFLEK